MTDITQRLRRPTFAIVTAHELMHEAADAIDRLNARLVAMAKEYEAARDDNDRLRAALNFIATHNDSEWPERCRLNVERARAALGE